MEKWSYRVGVSVLALAVLLRLGSTGVLAKLMQTVTGPEAVGMMMLLESGRVMRPAAAEQPATTVPQTQAPTQPTQPAEPKPVLPVFAPDDASLVKVNSACGYDTDVPAWLQQPLQWQLQQETPTVLIVHSHGTESYENTENYTPSGYYRTRDTAYNVVSVGAALAQELRQGGISVIHDTTMHDDPSYNDAYDQSRSSIQAYLQQYPSICLVLDLHRDAVASDSGQIKYTVSTPEGTAAQMMLVVGTDAKLSHPRWPENMALAVKLHALLEKNYPGICRPISFRTSRFNQDLSSGAVLVEMGAAGNSRQEALLAAKLLGKTLLQLSNGA